MAGDVLGYARVSTGDQDVAGQAMRLTGAGAIKVFTDVRSGRSMDRPGLAALLDYARAGDTLAVVRLDRLGRSLAELLASVAVANRNHPRLGSQSSGARAHAHCTGAECPNPRSLQLGA